MNNRRSTILFSILVMTLLFLVSCTDPCDSTYCVPDQGECFDGDCVCLVQRDTVNGQEILTYWGGDSCNIDLCLNLPCVNGDCVFGICECEAGFGGEDCSYLLRTPYIDSFNVVNDICSNDSLGVAPASYTTFIQEDTSRLDFVFITNFYYDSTTTKISARVSEFGLEIEPSPQQITTLTGTYNISGNSTPYDSLGRVMSFVYSVTNNQGNLINDCTVELRKP